MELKNFQIVAKLGQGGYGCVYLGLGKNKMKNVKKNQAVAIKAISKKYEKSIKTEIEIFKKVHAKPFLSQLLGVIHDRTAVFLVLRFEEHGSLNDFLSKWHEMPLDRSRNFTIDIILGLEYLHVQNIIHGDLKPDNILLDSNLRAHIADFGISRILSPGVQFYGKWGTPGYQSPEQLIGNIALDHRIDYFAVGIILCQILTMKHPFGADLQTIEQNVLKTEYNMPEVLPDNGKSFVKKLLCPVQYRLNVTTIKKHPFIFPHVDVTLASYEPYEKVYEYIPDIKFYDNINFFKSISGLEEPITEQNSVANDGEEMTIDDQDREQSSMYDGQRIINDTENDESVEQSSDSDADIVSRLNEQLNKYIAHNPNAAGSKVITIQKHVFYKVQCIMCPKQYKVNDQRKKLHYTINWNIQPFERHFDKKH